MTLHASRAGSGGPQQLHGLIAAALAGLFLALTGAFGSEAMPMRLRLAYWIGLCLTGTLVRMGLERRVLAPVQPTRSPWFRLGVRTVCLVASLTLPVWLAGELAFGRPIRLGALAHYVWPVLVVTIAVSAMQTLRQTRSAEPQPRPEDRTPPPHLLERLAPAWRTAELYAVQAEDHYLRLHTSRGQQLILMRLGDALAQLPASEGAQTHRSWWVARAAIEDIRHGAGRATLYLKGGVRAPVSRTYAAVLRAAGWI